MSELDPQDYEVLRHCVMKAAGVKRPHSVLNHISEAGEKISLTRLSHLFEEDRIEITVKNAG